MEKLILFIKTYRNDFDNAVNLLKSIDKFNVEKIPVVVSVNDADYDFFKERIKTVKIIKDSDVVTTTITDPWRYQQIIKAPVAKRGLLRWRAAARETAIQRYLLPATMAAPILRAASRSLGNCTARWAAFSDSENRSHSYLL